MGVRRSLFWRICTLLGFSSPSKQKTIVIYQQGSHNTNTVNNDSQLHYWEYERANLISEIKSARKRETDLLVIIATQDAKIKADASLKTLKDDKFKSKGDNESA